MDLLRQIVASPRARHPEANLDLCYVTDFIVATSGPSGTYPQVAYRNPLKDLVKFLDSKHGKEWSIWEFRAEGTGYPDEEVYNRIRHYPWPDHHPPPFNLIPLIMGSMRNWLKGEDAEGKGRVAVVHCKAGKGRSGTISCSYLIAEEGWTAEEALKRFTERRMRPGFGSGISIPSQLRWISYVDRWTRGGKIYVERPVEIVELHVWGLRDGVKIGIDGFVDEGKIIKTFHRFKKIERQLVRGEIRKDTGFADVAFELMGKKAEQKKDPATQVKEAEKVEQDVKRADTDDSLPPGGDVIFKPSQRVVLPTSDINLDFERRNKSKYGGFTMVTSVAHVWFNAFFEGNGPENKGVPDDSGVFEIEFDAMDGIKGSSRKGTRCFDKISVVWKAVEAEREPSVVITEPGQHEEIPQARAADWKGADHKSDDVEKKLGLRAEDQESADISRASSMKEGHHGESDSVKDEIETVRQTGADGRPLHSAGSPTSDKSSKNPLRKIKDELTPNTTSQVGGTSEEAQGPAHVSTASLPDGVPEEQLKQHKEHLPGSVKFFKKDQSS